MSINHSQEEGVLGVRAASQSRESTWQFGHQTTEALFPLDNPSSHTFQASKPDCQHLWLQWQFLAANCTFTFGVPSLSWTHFQSFSVFILVLFLCLYVKCQWSSLLLNTRNDGHSLLPLILNYISQNPLPSFVVNWIPPLRAMYTGLRSGRKPANSAPWHQLAESLASGIPSKHLPLYYDLLQFLGLPGLPNFSSKPEQEWQLPLTLAPLALQQFWKHPILRIKSFFFSRVIQ